MSYGLTPLILKSIFENHLPSKFTLIRVGKGGRILTARVDTTCRLPARSRGLDLIKVHLSREPTPAAILAAILLRGSFVTHHPLRFY